MFYKGAFFKRAANKLKRELFDLPLLRSLDAHAYLDALESHNHRLPAVDTRDYPILQQLRANGACAVPVESFGFAETAAMLEAATTLADELRAVDGKDDNAPRIETARLFEFPAIYTWGLNERLLNLVENYLQLPVGYYGPSLRREIADNLPNDVRQWHVDPDDRRMCRVIIYLSDVGVGGGPFEYLERNATTDAQAKLNYGSGFVADAKMEKAIPRSLWRQATGARHTLVIADTCRVFHRAQPPRVADRYSVTYTWKSTTPRKLYPSEPVPASSFERICSHLTARQRATIAGVWNAR